MELEKKNEEGDSMGVAGTGIKREGVTVSGRRLKEARRLNLIEEAGWMHLAHERRDFVFVDGKIALMNVVIVCVMTLCTDTYSILLQTRSVPSSPQCNIDRWMTLLQPSTLDLEKCSTWHLWRMK